METHTKAQTHTLGLPVLLSALCNRWRTESEAAELEENLAVVSVSIYKPVLMCKLFTIFRTPPISKKHTGKVNPSETPPTLNKEEHLMIS